MLKLFFTFFILFLFLINSGLCKAANSYVSVVNPIRGGDFWDSQEKPIDAVLGQIEILKKFNMTGTWLIRFDALSNSQIQDVIKTFSKNQELGLFLEVTPTWTKEAGVEYRKSAVWHLAGSVFLSGYDISERQKLIDSAFTKFKNTFGVYPKSVGAWWIDSYSLDYMQKKYGIDGALIVADQYSTDNYQIWGQYFGTPYYPFNKNALIPAQNIENKISVVMMQWASRDPINGYGEGVNETTYSVQANDYLDYHNLNSDYFGKLVDVYTKQSQNQFNYLIAGLENSYSWKKYHGEYQKQIEILVDRQNKSQISIVTMADFATWYKKKFPEISPQQIIIADDPLGTFKKAVWFMDPYYRAGWFYNKDGSVLRDIRQYTEGQIEPCFETACKQINFATFSTRVLDDVTYGQKLVLDAGKIKDFSVSKKDGNYVINYINEVDKLRTLEFLPRDISIDGRISSIDGLILEAQKLSKNNKPLEVSLFPGIGNFQETFINFSIKTIKFIAFIILVLFIPGFIFVKRIGELPFILKAFLSIVFSFCLLTLISYLSGYLKIFLLVPIYLVASWIFFVIKKDYQNFSFHIPLKKENILLFVLIILGTFFQVLALVRSGWVYDFGVGFWGPLGHDGIWHQALINQLIINIPPINPAFSSTFLSNYHYFYDLLLATTFKLTQIPVLDLIYRFYPILFSLLLGIGSYFLCYKILKNKIAGIISLFFIYFGGSFGWVIDILKRREIGGESAFWMNQPISFNLNPPFAISLIILICATLLFLEVIKNQKLITQILLIIVAGVLIEFKVYAGVIFLGSLLVVSIWQVISERKFYLLKIFAGSAILSAIVFLPQNLGSGDLLVFSPFWFIHSMIDYSDRVGWERITMGREAYIQRGDWLKFILVEILGLILFIVGNLGTRIIALPRLMTLKIESLKDKTSCLLLFMIIISIIIPLLFIQKGNSWNTIQFAYYWLYFVSIFMGSSILFIYQKLPKFISLSLIIVILLITSISSLATFKNGIYPTPPATLPGEEFEALTFLQKEPQGNVLTYSFDKTLRQKFSAPYPLFVYETTAYISAFSGKPVFLEDEIQQEILQNSDKKRLVAANDFFNGRDLNWSSNFLKEQKIRYIYLPKYYMLSLDTEKLNLDKILENKEVIIYEVLN